MYLQTREGDTVISKEGKEIPPFNWYFAKWFEDHTDDVTAKLKIDGHWYQVNTIDFNFF